MMSFRSYSLRKMCKYSEFLWYVFSRIWTEYRDLLWRSPYSVRMRENTDQKNSKYGHFYVVTDSYTMPEKNWNTVRNNRDPRDVT